MAIPSLAFQNPIVFEILKHFPDTVYAPTYHLCNFFLSKTQPSPLDLSTPCTPYELPHKGYRFWVICICGNKEPQHLSGNLN